MLDEPRAARRSSPPWSSSASGRCSSTPGRRRPPGDDPHRRGARGHPRWNDQLCLPALAAAVGEERRHAAHRRGAARDSGRHPDPATRHLRRRGAACGLCLGGGACRRTRATGRRRDVSHRFRKAASRPAHRPADAGCAHRGRRRRPARSPRAARRRGARRGVDPADAGGDSQSRRLAGGRPVPLRRPGAAPVQGQRPQAQGAGPDREPRRRLPPVAARVRRARDVEVQPAGV